MNTGIYKIENKVNGKLYIGGSTNLKRRHSDHFSYLRRNSHDNSNLQIDYNKYGKDNFIFSIILYCSSDDLLFYEQRAIDAYDFKMFLYNSVPTAGNNTGMKHSDATKYKISKTKKGSTPWNKGRRNVGNLKPVLQYDLDGNFIKEYISIKDAKDKTGISAVNHCLKYDNYKTAGGYIWKYKE